MLFKGKGSRCASRQLDRPVGWARQGGRLSDGRFGSLADIATRPNDVRFTPDSGYLLAPAECSVWCHKQTLAALIPPPRLWLSDCLSLEAGLRYIKAAVGQFRYRCRPSEAV